MISLSVYTDRMIYMTTNEQTQIYVCRSCVTGSCSNGFGCNYVLLCCVTTQREHAEFYHMDALKGCRDIKIILSVKIY